MFSKGKICPAQGRDAIAWHRGKELTTNSTDERQKQLKRWTLYILECADGSLYTGITTELAKRIKRHNEGRAANYTRVRKPVKLIYSEDCCTESEARKREIKIKKSSRADKLKMIR